MKTLATLLVLATTLTLSGCSDKAPTEEPLVLPKYKFEPADFGIGRKHTKNESCNRQIDALLEPIVQCYNTQASETCKAMQDKTNERITRLKNTVHCRR